MAYLLPNQNPNRDDDEEQTIGGTGGGDAATVGVPYAPTNSTATAAQQRAGSYVDPKRVVQQNTQNNGVHTLTHPINTESTKVQEGIRQAKDRFLSEAGGDNPFDRGETDLLDSVLNGYGTVDEGRALFQSQYKGPNELDQSPFSSAVKRLGQQATALGSRAGIQTLQQERVPNTTPGERRFNSMVWSNQPGWNADVNYVRGSANAVADELAGAVDSTRERASIREQQERDIAMKSRDYVQNARTQLAQTLDHRVAAQQLTEDEMQRQAETGRRSGKIVTHTPGDRPTRANVILEPEAVRWNRAGELLDLSDLLTPAQRRAGTLSIVDPPTQEDAPTTPQTPGVAPTTPATPDTPSGPQTPTVTPPVTPPVVTGPTITIPGTGTNPTGPDVRWAGGDTANPGWVDRRDERVVPYDPSVPATWYPEDFEHGQPGPDMYAFGNGGMKDGGLVRSLRRMAHGGRVGYANGGNASMQMYQDMMRKLTKQMATPDTSGDDPRSMKPAKPEKPAKPRGYADGGSVEDYWTDYTAGNNTGVGAQPSAGYSEKGDPNTLGGKIGLGLGTMIGGFVGMPAAAVALGAKGLGALFGEPQKSFAQQLHGALTKDTPVAPMSLEEMAPMPPEIDTIAPVELAAPELDTIAPPEIAPPELSFDMESISPTETQVAEVDTTTESTTDTEGTTDGVDGGDGDGTDGGDGGDGEGGGEGGDGDGGGDSGGAGDSGSDPGGWRRGGEVDGPGGPRDDLIPARLSDGEYVVKANSTSALGVDMMDKINALGDMPKSQQKKVRSGFEAALRRLSMNPRVGRAA